MKKPLVSKKYLFTFILITSLFALWGFANDITNPMVAAFQTVMELSAAKASLIQFAFYGGYATMAIPAALFIRRYSYKSGILLGLALYAIGAFLFIPAAEWQEFSFFCISLYILTFGLAFLETTANPFILSLGDKETSTRRLNLAQAFNGLGAFIAAMFLSKIILGTGANTSVESEIHTFRWTYAIFAIVLIVIAIVFIFTHLPRIQAEDEDTQGSKLISFKVLKRRHLRNGVIAQFFYNGGQTAVNSLFLVYCINYVGMTNSQATTFFGFYMLFFLLGRWIGTTLMVKFRPENMLVVYGVANVLLCIFVCTIGGKAAVYAMMGISFFMSIMYPTQFSLALVDLKGDTKSGSAFLVMAIVGNSILPILTAYVQKSMTNPNIAYIIPLICFAVCAWYGWKGHKVTD